MMVINREKKGEKETCCFVREEQEQIDEHAQTLMTLASNTSRVYELKQMSMDHVDNVSSLVVA